eukprot:m51a1_g13332 hypothetical protein (105) ;mRNA; r:495-809
MRRPISSAACRVRTRTRGQRLSTARNTSETTPSSDPERGGSSDPGSGFQLRLMTPTTRPVGRAGAAGEEEEEEEALRSISVSALRSSASESMTVAHSERQRAAS